MLLALAFAFVFLVTIGPPAAAALPSGADPAVGVFGSLVDLRPGTSPADGADAASITLAQNETGSYQLLVPGPLKEVEARPTALTGPLGTAIASDSITVYREADYSVKSPSDAAGGVGPWPDALIPSRDPLYGEPRDAFPVDVPTGGDLAVWVDVTADFHQPPGVYHGSVQVLSAGVRVATVPVTATVRPFRIPSTTTFKSAFFVDSQKICAAFGDCGREKRWADAALFAEAALDNRLTLANAYAGTPTEPGFDRFFLPLVEGKAPHVFLPGARLTSVEVWGPSCADCLGPWKEAADQHEFGGRFFLYACDEPATPIDWKECERNVLRGERDWPGVRALVTASYEPNADWVDIYVPLIEDLDPANLRNLLFPSAAAEYGPWLASGPGRELWSYSSCRSYSCTEVEGPEYVGWPGYAIDEPPFEAGAMALVAYLLGATGELYYSTTESLATATTDQYVSGGNGDGNLFYAGTPAGGHGTIAVGGKRPIPIESIRLKRIRDGRELYEYLHLAEEQGRGLVSRAIVASLFGSAATSGHETDVPAAHVEAVRRELGELVEQGSA